MVFRKIFGHGGSDNKQEEPIHTGPGSVMIRVEVNGKSFVQTYADLEMAELRFPAYLSDLRGLYAGHNPGDPS